MTVIVRAFAKLGKHMEAYYDLLASVDKLGHLFDLPTEKHDGIMEMDSEGPAALSVGTLSHQKPANRKHLHAPISFEASPGTSVALLGSSGSGKSTLLDLIYGLRIPTGGHVTIDGFDPQDLRSDVLRANVSLIRRSEIFHGSLEENIHLHRANVTSADVRESLEQVGLYDQVLQLPDGFDTKLTPDGVPLSGTQADMLCIARAISGKPRLLLVDGLLDGLADEELDVAMDSLLHVDRTWTLIIATGRRYIAERCDQLILLSNDRPTETKSKEEVPS